MGNLLGTNSLPDGTLVSPPLCNLNHINQVRVALYPDGKTYLVQLLVANEPAQLIDTNPVKNIFVSGSKVILITEDEKPYEYDVLATGDLVYHGSQNTKYFTAKSAEPFPETDNEFFNRLKVLFPQ